MKDNQTDTIRKKAVKLTFFAQVKPKNPDALKILIITHPMLHTPRNELILYLIKEDLRCQKFFDGLRDLGLDDTWYQPDLATLLLTQAGFDTESDAENDRYYQLKATHCQTLQANNESLTEHALTLYSELMNASPLNHK